MNGKLTAGEITKFAKQTAILAAAEEKHRIIKAHQNSDGNWVGEFTASLTTMGAHGMSDPVRIDSEAVREMTRAEYHAILRIFSAAQGRVVGRLAQDIKDRYGVDIDGITPISAPPVNVDQALENWKNGD